MKDSKKKTKSIIIMLILAAVLAMGYFFLNTNETLKEDSMISPGDNSAEEAGAKEEKSEEDEAEEGKRVIALRETTDAYEYILSIMNAPQYWSEEEYFPLYSAKYLEEEAREVLVNGTGWTLADAKTASFKRGYEGELTICFSNHTAISKDPSVGYEYYFDFNNEIYEIRKDEKKVGSFEINKSSDSYMASSFFLLEKTFTDYEEVFSAAGCPLLNKPEGTLSSYKGKHVKKVSLEDDGLIHSVWAEEGFTFNWEENDGLCWLTNAKEIESIDVPQSELTSSTVEFLDGHTETFAVGIYSPLFLVLADKDSSCRYQKQDGSVWFEDISYYDNITESLAAHFLMPAMKNLYGHCGVFFIDAASLSGPGNPKVMLTKDEFDKGFSFDTSKASQLIMHILPLGDNFVYMSYQADSNYTLYSNLFNSIREVYLYYEKDFPYAEDFLARFLLVYSLDDQILLGLR